MLADPATEPTLRGQLEIVLAAREHAAGLGLEVDGQYTSYLAWPEDRIVTSVVATRPGEIEPAGFTFPFLGTVPYKGYFDRARAEAEAERLRAEGLDVCVLAVPAYSTLGFLDDPITDPMIRHGDHYLVETVIHELVHATVFAADAADFNEGLATFVGQEGAVRFFGARGDDAAMRAEVADDRAVQTVLTSLRERIAALYADTSAGPERVERRAALEAEARAALAALPLRGRDAARLAEAARLNDACLSIAGTYAGDIPRYVEKLEALGGDIEALLEEAEAASESDDPRAALLGPAR